MKRLKIILHSNYFLLICFLLLLFYLFYSFTFVKSKYQKNDISFEGTILSKKIYEGYAILEIKGKEKLLVQYTFSSIKLIQNLKIGDVISFKGTLELPSSNRNFHLFNYQKYLKGKQIFWIAKTDSIILKKPSSGFYLWKDKLIRKMEKKKQASYYFSFLLGDSSSLKKKNLYQELGISHLFAVSGMHILFIAGFLSKLFQKLCSKTLISFFLVTVVLTFYIWLLSDSASANRAYLLYLFSFLNKYYKLQLSSLKLLLFVLMISIFKNPFCLFQIGFQFSFLICFFLMLKKRDSKGYIKDLWITSSLAFLVSLPLSLYHFHQIHLGSICFNMIAVPFVTIILFPLSFLSFFFPIFENLFCLCIGIFEFTIDSFKIFDFLKLIFPAYPVFSLFFYYFILIFGFIKTKKILVFFFLLLFLHFLTPYINNSYWVDMIDIKEGDAILIRYPHLEKTILIDCGGRLPFQKNSISQVDNIFIPYMKALGVKKIDILILSHGDYDHMGNAIELVEKFKVEKVIFNCGEWNELEQNLIKVLEKKKLKYYSCIKELKTASNKLYFLNTREYENENDNSSVIYTELSHYKFLFMGDAGEKKEKEILNKYKLQDIDVLKVGHHGSKTSSSEEFIDRINPKYSIISVGKNNRYGHPNQEVLKNLANSKIYRTDKNGGIQIKLSKNGYQMKTCHP